MAKLLLLLGLILFTIITEQVQLRHINKTVHRELSPACKATFLALVEHSEICKQRSIVASYSFTSRWSATCCTLIHYCDCLLAGVSTDRRSTPCSAAIGAEILKLKEIILSVHCSSGMMCRGYTNGDGEVVGTVRPVPLGPPPPIDFMSICIIFIIFFVLMAFCYHLIPCQYRG